MISKDMYARQEASSEIRKMFSEGRRLAKMYGADNVYDFSIGNPNLLPPEALNRNILDILEMCTPAQVHGWQDNAGIPEVRQSLADYENRTKGTWLSKENLIMCYGAAGGLNAIFRVILEEGDEVLTFAPYFSEYNHYVGNYGGVIRAVPANPPTFAPDLRKLESMITIRTKAVLINSPNNPTGVVYTEEMINGIATVLEQKQKEYGHGILLISDEPYREILYSDQELPYILNHYKNSVVVYSYSKTLSIPGERIGYITLNPELDELELMTEAIILANGMLGFNSAPSLFQKVAANLAGEKVDVDYYRRNRDTLCRVLDEKGIEFVKPEGAFYLFVKAPVEDDVLFCETAKEHHILVVPMKGFGCPGYFRIAYCIPYEKVMASLGAFRDLFDRFM